MDSTFASLLREVEAAYQVAHQQEDVPLLLSKMAAVTACGVKKGLIKPGDPLDPSQKIEDASDEQLALLLAHSRELLTEHGHKYPEGSVVEWSRSTLIDLSLKLKRDIQPVRKALGLDPNGKRRN